jgi:hypothetical protein
MKKLLILPIALIALATLPARAHHEQSYGVFWKPGTGAQALRAPAGEFWRYGFVSKFRWSCGNPLETR